MQATGSLYQEGHPYRGLDYSNEDIEVLHMMVKRAMEIFPTLPYREQLNTFALFRAYYEILPSIGKDPNHDNRYARVLFKIGGLRGPETMLKKFERVLAKMNIIVEYEYGEDWEGENSMRRDNPTIGTNQSRYEDRYQDTMNSDKLPRRNSESTKWDLGTENPSTRQTKSADGDMNGEKREEFIREMQRSRPSAPVPEQMREHPAENSRELVEDWLYTHQPKRFRGRSDMTIDSVGAHQSETSTSYDRRSSPPISYFPPSDEFPDPSDTAITSNELAEPEEPADSDQQTPNMMNIKASVVFQYNSALAAKRQVQQWRERALEIRNRRLQMERVADTHDRTVLMSGALAGWRALSIERRQAKESEIFYEHLEERAEKARDLYLTSKALQHWANNTQEQVARTTAARNHIVESRCFNAWHQITTVNDFKVKRNVLKKFFGVWRKRKEEVDNYNSAAIQIYQENLAHKVYLKWVHEIWENRAYEFYTDGLKCRIFYSWQSKHQQMLERQRIVEQNHRDQIAHNALLVWKDGKAKRIRQEAQAAAFYRTKVLSNALRNWGKEARIIPAQQAVQFEVKDRLLRGVLATWAHRAKQEKRAAAVDREKILKEAVVTWRHRLRQKAIADKVQTRVKGECMYKLVLAQRCCTMQRARKEVKLRGILQSWADKAIDARELRLDQEAIADEYAKQKALNTILGLWYTRMDHQKEMEAQAVEFANSRLLEEAITTMLRRAEEQARHVRGLEMRADSAAYYFRASRAMKTWRAAAAFSVREKQKAAYIKVKRIVKLNMARKFFRSWREEANRVMALNQQAKEVLRNKDIVRGMEMFDKWRARTADVEDMEEIAREQQLKKHLAIWKYRADEHQLLENEAEIIYEENRQNRVFKKWNLATLRIQADENYAVDIREKNAKKHFRKMFTHWQQQAAIAASQPRPPPLPSPTKREPQKDRRTFMTSMVGEAQAQKRPAQEPFSMTERPRKRHTEAFDMTGRFSLRVPETLRPDRGRRRPLSMSERTYRPPETPKIAEPDARMETWSDYGEGDGDLVPPRIPGYLNTPSRRRKLSTTPKAPLSTPFERQLRAQYGQLHSARGRNRLGMSSRTISGFEDIEEASF